MSVFRQKNFLRSDRSLIVAEVSANHQQDFEKAVQLIKVAKACGADAVKFQAYEPETLTIDANNGYFQVIHPEWGGQTLYQLYKKAYTPLYWLKDLKRIADKEKIVFFATAFDKRTVDLLEDIDVPFHKIASFELVDLSLVEYAAKMKKPLILSTGMATLNEIRQAVNIAKNAGAKDIVLLKCVSSYPAKPEEMNLSTIADMKKKFSCQIGLSDHTLGTAVSVAAVCLGAKVIEKHFTLSRRIKTPDSFFSIEPAELKELVSNVRLAEKAIGHVHYGLTAEEKGNLIFRRSLFAVEDIKSGEIITERNIRSIRPGNGAAPKYYKTLLGKKARTDIKKGTPLKLDMVR